MPIIIENGQEDGGAIARTNYWFTEHAQKGLFYLSWNARTARLLIPPSQEAMLNEMRTGETVIMTRGPWADAGGKMSWEIMFEDHSDEPFAIYLQQEQCDRLLPPSDMGRHVRFAVWTRGGPAFECPGLIRSAKSLPYLKPWSNTGRR